MRRLVQFGVGQCFGLLSVEKPERKTIPEGALYARVLHRRLAGIDGTMVFIGPITQYLRKIIGVL